MLFGRKSNYDWLVVGLGNPGPKYENTRHNAGFIVLDKLAGKHGAVFSRSKFRGETAVCNAGGQKLLMLKPMTMMNLSGESVQAAASYYKIPVERILVIFDDISLDVGRMRIRRNGSDGGHNGIKNICLYLDQSFPRIKMGVGNKPDPQYDLAAWVLSKFGTQERKQFDSVADDAAEAALMIISGDIDGAMNKYNS